MAEIVFGIAEKIVTDLGSVALQEVGSALGVKKELKKLQDTVSTIKAVLVHAEELQLHDTQVREWLKKVKDAAYEADDVIDDFAFEALRKKLMVQGKSLRLVRNFFSSSNPIVFRFKMARRIKEIRESFQGIAADRSSFHLETRVEEKRVHNSGREQTHSYVFEENVFGRENDKENIVKLLLDANEQDSPSVIAIQGMGGLGKTTLAQLVFNDKRVVYGFTQKMWVCVGEEFDVKKTTEKIIKSATDSECPNLEMDQLQSRLRKELEEKKFLLVLDDIWSEDVEKWMELKGLLMGGARGSKIIVTTRSEKVASIMRTVPTYKLPLLSDNDCWTLFESRAFEAGQDHRAHPEFVKIGKDIVSKCGGVPLAAKTLGSLMRFKTEQHEWELVRSSDVWRLPQKENDILPALRISYNHLPFYLRQCFAYCSVFPKDYVIGKERLIQFWIAQGFIHPSGENRSLDDIGNEYIKDLMWRSFFQEPKIGSYENLESFKMHDLVHDLAKSVAGVECFTVSEDTNEIDISSGVRHSFFTEESTFSFESSDIIGKIPNLRTLLFASKMACSVDNIFSSFKFLRVLFFENNHTESLPNSIGKLKHLRFLGLRYPKIKTLPKSITNLLSLQTLEVSGCRQLEKLPENIGMMVNLKHICINEYGSLSYHPFGLEKLTSLQTLSVFILGEGGEGCELNELNGLINLGGKLTIKNLEKMRNSVESAKANLKGKQNLQVLKLLWNQVSDESVSREEIAFEVLGNLEPHRNLKILEVEGYPGSTFPPWMMEPSLPNVVEVTLKGCRKCQQVPPFGQLPSLKILKLEEMYDLECLPEDGLQGLTSLVSLRISDCKSLTSLSAGMRHLTALQALHISSLPKLVALPESMGNLTSLQYLYISSEELRSLPDSMGNLTSLQHLYISSEELRSLPDSMGNLTSLQHLYIYSEELRSLPDSMGNFTSLQNLTISSEELRSLPDSMGNLTSLQHVYIYSSELRSLPDSMGNLTSLQNLYISSEELQSLPDSMGNLTSLQHLSIDSKKLQSLPDSMGNLTSLLNLRISSSELRSLPDSTVNLTSLERLRIIYCPNIRFLPTWMSRLISLRELKIIGCDNLTSRCKKETGEDWPQIAHVKRIKLNDRIIQEQ